LCGLFPGKISVGVIAVRFPGYLVLLAGVSSPAHAQFFDFLADWSDAEPSDTRALAADITATLKAHSPWGDITTIESGKYWRNSKGQDRFDDSYGLSTLRDRRGPVIEARIDRPLRRVDIEEIAASHEPTRLPRDPWSILPFEFARVALNKAGGRIVEGLKATVRTGEDHGVSYEVWTSDQLGLVLFARYKTDHTVFEQRIHNIRFVEPEPEIVKLSVPGGFRTHIMCSSNSGPEWEPPRQIFEPGRELCK
jgi:hypothetical protein